MTLCSPQAMFQPAEAGWAAHMPMPKPPNSHRERGRRRRPTSPSPTAVFSSHQLMTHMWFVMHQPHAGNPKNNPIKASYMAEASMLGRPLPGLPLLGVGVGMS